MKMSEKYGIEAVNKVEKITKSVSECMGLTVSQLDKSNRTRMATDARSIVWYLATVEYDCQMSLEDLGFMFGITDHTTVMHGREKARGLITTYGVFRELVNEIKSKIHFQ